MALSHASCSCPAASSMVFVRWSSWRLAAAPATLGLPFGALRRAMPSVHASVQPRCWRRRSRVAQTYTVLPATQN